MKFEDEIDKDLLSGPASPASGIYSKPDKYRFQPIIPQPITPQSKALGDKPARIGTIGSSTSISQPGGQVHTQAELDEATIELLKLSSEPTKVTYSTNPRISPNADKLPKAASTNSMHKVIRTNVSLHIRNPYCILHINFQDGGTVKIANQFSWDTNRLKEAPSQQGPRTETKTTTSTTKNADGTESTSKTRETTHEDSVKRPGPPIVRTTVEGKLKMEKMVGKTLISVDHQIAKAYTIRDTVTHYKIRTTMGKRSVIIEERPGSGMADDGVRSSGTYRLSVFEDGQEVGTHEANIKVPDNVVSSFFEYEKLHQFRIFRASQTTLPSSRRSSSQI